MFLQIKGNYSPLKVNWNCQQICMNQPLPPTSLRHTQESDARQVDSPTLSNFDLFSISCTFLCDVKGILEWLQGKQNLHWNRQSLCHHCLHKPSTVTNKMCDKKYWCHWSELHQSSKNETDKTSLLGHTVFLDDISQTLQKISILMVWNWEKNFSL